jgi:hypothetical protein
VTASVPSLSDEGAIERVDRLPPWATFGLIRLGLWAFAAFTVLWYPLDPAHVPALTVGGKLPSLFFGTFDQWDGGNFLYVAQHGYDTHRAAFLPAYPGLVHAVAWGTRSLLVAALLVSFGAALVGVAYTSRIARDLLGDAVARDTAILLALYPVALVFTAPYSEGLYLATAAGSMYCGTRGRFWAAGALAGLAIATRSLGLALVPGLLVLAWPEVRRRRVGSLVPIIGLPLAALVAVASYYTHALGDPFAFVHAQKYWGRSTVTLGPLSSAWMSAKAAYHGVVTLSGAPRDFGVTRLAVLNTIDFLVLVGAVALTVVVFRRLGTAFGVYSACLLAIATAEPATDGSELLTSLPRFVLVDFPLFIVAAVLLQRGSTRRGAVLGALTAVSALACVAFSRALWVS